MATAPVPDPLRQPAAEFERQFQWRWWAMLGFLGLMLGLAALAIASLVVTPRVRTGVPDDPDARAAFALVGPSLDAGLLELRLDSEIGVLARPSGHVVADDLARAERAERMLIRAIRRHPLDPRLYTALGHLDLARQRPRHAENDYRTALDLAPHHDEARLGLGVVLARRAALETNPMHQRRLQLRALAQFAAVRRDAAVAADAAWNRAALLAEIGRHDEARRWAGAYFARDPSGPWAERLRERLEQR